MSEDIYDVKLVDAILRSAEGGRGSVDVRDIGSFVLGNSSSPSRVPPHDPKIKALIVDGRFYGARDLAGKVFLDKTDDLEAEKRVIARETLYS